MSDESLKVGDWVRNERTGDLGKVLEEDGKLVIAPDSPLSPVRYPHSMFREWKRERYATRIPVASLAVVCQAADRALCQVHPDFRKQKDWLSMTQFEKKDWIEGRVDLKEPLRSALREAILQVLEKHQ